jgi:hypothetical protein
VQQAEIAVAIAKLWIIIELLFLALSSHGQPAALFDALKNVSTN